MKCPRCGGAMKYRNQDFVSHGYYCKSRDCLNFVHCDKECCPKPKICPRCFGSGNWPWAQWGGPIPCVACDATGKISDPEAWKKVKEAPVDRRNPKCPPRPGMIWNIPHQMWIDVDNRSPERKAADEKLAADTEARWKREGKI